MKINKLIKLDDGEWNFCSVCTREEEKYWIQADYHAQVSLFKGFSLWCDLCIECLNKLKSASKRD